MAKSFLVPNLNCCLEINVTTTEAAVATTTLLITHQACYNTTLGQIHLLTSRANRVEPSSCEVPSTLILQLLMQRTPTLLQLVWDFLACYLVFSGWKLLKNQAVTEGYRANNHHAISNNQSCGHNSGFLCVSKYKQRVNKILDLVYLYQPIR